MTKVRFSGSMGKRMQRALTCARQAGSRTEGSCSSSLQWLNPFPPPKEPSTSSGDILHDSSPRSRGSDFPFPGLLWDLLYGVPHTESGIGVFSWVCFMTKAGSLRTPLSEPQELSVEWPDPERGIKSIAHRVEAPWEDVAQHRTCRTRAMVRK